MESTSEPLETEMSSSASIPTSAEGNLRPASASAEFPATNTDPASRPGPALDERASDALERQDSSQNQDPEQASSGDATAAAPDNDPRSLPKPENGQELESKTVPVPLIMSGDNGQIDDDTATSAAVAAGASAEGKDANLEAGHSEAKEADQGHGNAIQLEQEEPSQSDVVEHLQAMQGGDLQEQEQTESRERAASGHEAESRSANMEVIEFPTQAIGLDVRAQSQTDAAGDVAQAPQLAQPAEDTQMSAVEASKTTLEQDAVPQGTEGTNALAATANAVDGGDADAAISATNIGAQAKAERQVGEGALPSVASAPMTSGAGPSRRVPTALDPPLPINHALTEPITAFYKLQFGADGDPAGFAYYMQTLDVAIGRKVVRTSAVAAATGEAGDQQNAAAVDGAASGPSAQEGSAPESAEQPPLPQPANNIVGPSSAAAAGATAPASASAPTVAAPTADDDDDENNKIDVDLGALKSVSRLHARIGYSYTLSQFYLEVLGRNGAWVDDVFVVRGSRVALGPYTKIQISTRTFFFILPPSSAANYPIAPEPYPLALPPDQQNVGADVPFGGPEYDLSHPYPLNPLFQRPATFNAFSNREDWAQERMALFGDGSAEPPVFGYRRKRRRHRRRSRDDVAADGIELSGEDGSLDDDVEGHSLMHSHSGDSEGGFTGASSFHSSDDYDSDESGSEGSSSGSQGSESSELSELDSESSEDERRLAEVLDKHPDEVEADDDDSGSEYEEPLAKKKTAKKPAKKVLSPPPPSPAAAPPARKLKLKVKRPQPPPKSPQETSPPQQQKESPPVSESDAEEPPAPAPPPIPRGGKGKGKGKGGKSVKMLALLQQLTEDVKDEEEEVQVVDPPAKSNGAKAGKIPAKTSGKGSKAPAKKSVASEAPTNQPPLPSQEVISVEDALIGTESLVEMLARPLQVQPLQAQGHHPYMDPMLPLMLQPAANPPPHFLPGQGPMPPPGYYPMGGPPRPHIISSGPPPAPGQRPVPLDALRNGMMGPGPPGAANSVPRPPGTPGPPPPPVPTRPIGLDGEPFIGPDPLKPDLTYATLIYRALAVTPRGRATQQQICHWIATEWEWFRLQPTPAWQSSVRAALTSNKAFLKVPWEEGDAPNPDGPIWVLDPVHAPDFIEKERKIAEVKAARIRREAQAQASRAAKEAKAKKAAADKAAKIKADEAAAKAKADAEAAKAAAAAAKPVTTAGKLSTPPTAATKPTAKPTPAPTTIPKPSAAPTPKPAPPPPASATAAKPTTSVPSKPPQKPTPTSTTSSAPKPVQKPAPNPSAQVVKPAGAGGAAPSAPVKKVPIKVAPIPAHLKNGSFANHSHLLDGPPLVVNAGVIILNPSIFAHFKSDHLQHLESLGAQQALKVLQDYIVQHLKEKMKAQAAAKLGPGKPAPGRPIPGQMPRPDMPATKPLGSLPPTRPLPVSAPRPMVPSGTSPAANRPLGPPSMAARPSPLPRPNVAGSGAPQQPSAMKRPASPSSAAQPPAKMVKTMPSAHPPSVRPLTAQPAPGPASGPRPAPGVPMKAAPTAPAGRSLPSPVPGSSPTPARPAAPSIAKGPTPPLPAPPAQPKHTQAMSVAAPKATVPSMAATKSAPTPAAPSKPASSSLAEAPARAAPIAPQSKPATTTTTKPAPPPAAPPAKQATPAVPTTATASPSPIPAKASPASSTTKPASATTPGKPAAKPAGTKGLSAETLRMISQIAATAGKGGKVNSTLTPNASALLQYLRQVGAAANMSIAAQILATGVIPPGAIPPKSAAASPKPSRSVTPASPVPVKAAVEKRPLDGADGAPEAKRAKS